MIAAGCGGGGGGETDRQTVRADAFSFAAPAGWVVRRDARSVSASDGGASVSVTVFRLAQPYRAALWAQATAELDRVADRLAQRLGGQVTGRSTRVVAGRRARVYLYSGARDGTRRIAFVLSGRNEYQLLCRWPHGRERDGGVACTELMGGFALS